MRADDPTSTLTLRNRAVSQISRRFNGLKSEIKRAIVEDDILNNGRFADLSDSQTMQAFMNWLHNLIYVRILSSRTGDTPEEDKSKHWLLGFIAASYVRGAQKSQVSFVRQTRKIVPTKSIVKETFYDPAPLGGIKRSKEIIPIDVVPTEKIPFPTDIVLPVKTKPPIDVVSPVKITLPIDIVSPVKTKFTLDVVPKERIPFPIDIVSPVKTKLPIDLIPTEKIPIPIDVVLPVKTKLPIDLIPKENIPFPIKVVSPDDVVFKPAGLLEKRINFPKKGKGFGNPTSVGLLESTIFETPKATVLGNKIHTDKLDVLYTRGYSQLKGITESMEQQIAHVLSDGMLKGMSPEAVANEINDRVDKIGKTRAKLIARTEIVYSHNVASIMETARLEGILEKELEMIWHTSIDGRERDTHRARHGKKYSKEEALALIGEPHCRCSVSPWVPEAEESK